MTDTKLEPSNRSQKYVDDNGSAAMLVTKRPAGITPEVNLREHASHTPLPGVNKAAHSDFETLKSKTGVSVILIHNKLWSCIYEINQI